MPTQPPADITQNMREAAEHWNPWWYKSQVDNGAPWDYKRQATWLIGGKYNPYEQFGNFNYGATAAPFGFPDAVILRMAGFRHWLDHPDQRARNGAPWPWMLQPFGDDPYDQQWVEAGQIYLRLPMKEGTLIPRVRCNRLVAMFLFILLFQTGCEAARQDIRRVPASGPAIEALLVERNPGATGDFFYEVHIVPRGAAASQSKEPVLKIMWAGPPASIALEWTTPSLLTINCCDEAIVMHFTNRWTGQDAEGRTRRIAVQLNTPNGRGPRLPQRALY